MKNFSIVYALMILAILLTACNNDTTVAGSTINNEQQQEGNNENTPPNPVGRVNLPLMANTMCGNFYTWGWDRDGQLGRTREYTSAPGVVKTDVMFR